MALESGTGKARILVVEDSETQRKHLVEMLQRRGYDVQEASGGLAALKAIKTDPPDVVLLDVVLDDIDGYSVCRWVRLSERTRDMVVIMLTVRSEPKERVEGLHVGADDYLPKPFDDDELEARMFAALRSRAARDELRKRNAELETMLTRTEQLAMTDPLTGLFNRRRFLDVLRREWATARRYGNPLTCAIIDLDHFKRINDVEGHGAGDAALRQVAAVLSESVREVDVCARYGGDEFALLFPHTARDKGIIAIERARTKLLQARPAWPGLAKGLGLCAGVATSEDPSLKTPDELLEAADRALYEAKRAGGDQIAMARPGILKGN
jgi:two-component system cell cycle response regulator